MIRRFLFQELSKAISQAINKYDNILLAGDLNIVVYGSKGLNDNNFSELIDTSHLTNLVKTPTCFKTTRETLLDVLLTNKPNSLQKTGVCETGLSNCHKMVFTIFCSTFIRLSPKPLNIGTIKALMKTFFS